MPDLKAFAAEIVQAVKEHVGAAVAPVVKRIEQLETREMPLPQKGDPGAAGKDGKDGQDGKAGLDGKDGAPGAQGAQGEAGIGKDGAPGKDGKDGRDVDYTAVKGFVAEAVATAVTGLPKAQDGRDAARLDPHSGIDVNRSYPRGDYALHAGGLWRAVKQTSAMEGWECVVNGVASIKIDPETEREFCVRATQSNGVETVARFRMATPLDRGVWRPDSKYEKGDGVTFGGSWFIAQVDNPTDKPEVSDQWRLAIKRGRDGRDGVMKPAPTPGKLKIGP